MERIRQSSLFQYSAEHSWEEVEAGIRRQVLGFDEHLMLVKGRFEKGAVGAFHSHPNRQASYVESGVLELTISEKKVLQKGDGYFVPPYVQHGCVCLEAGVLIDTFTPFREEFLKKIT